MTAADRIGHVLVAGGGLTAWYAAAALKRRAPFLTVTLLATAPAADALADRIASTLPSLPGFQADLGIGDDDGVTCTGAGYRLGTRFIGWAEGLPDYVHAYDGYGHPIGSAAFHLHWIRAAKEGEVAPFDAFAPAAQLARAGRFVPPSPNTPFARHDYGLTLDLDRQLTMIRAFAAHVGVREMPGEIAEVSVDAQTRVTGLRLADGRTVSADLYVDATGPAATLRSAVDDEWQDWRDWLPCDHILLATDEKGDGAPVLTDVTAHEAGWRWVSGEQRGIAYSGTYMSDVQAAMLLGIAPTAPITIRPGTRAQAWRSNCIAIGDAATQVEPLEWCNLHLALSAIDRLITMLPDRHMAQVEAADFNRQTLAEAERVRDFLAAHYHIARRPEPMWQAVATAAPPPGLAHSLGQFTERGRLPFYEEETFTRDSWAAILLCQGVMPRRVDPLVQATPPEDTRRAMARMTDAIAAALPHTPAHADWRAAQMRRLAR